MHVASLHFPTNNFQAYVNSKAEAEILFSDMRFDQPFFSDTKLCDQVIDTMSKSLTPVNLGVQPEKKGKITGVGYALRFYKIDPTKKIPSPSDTWSTQLMYSILDKLHEYGYELLSVTSSAGNTKDPGPTFYFKETRPVLNEFMGVTN